MKKFFSVVLAALLLVGCIAVFTSCGNDTIIVSTNAFFAPFEYYDGDKIVGVDVEIMELVGKKMDKKVKFENGEFSAIIDNVAAGKWLTAAPPVLPSPTSVRKKWISPFLTTPRYST